MPTAVEADSSTLTIQSDASIPQVPSLTGTGVVPAASFLQSSLSFAPQLIGQTSPSLVALLRNEGQVPLTIDLAHTTISGDFAIHKS